MVIFTIKRRPESLLPKFNQHANQLAISTITLAELIFGAEKSMNPAKNLATVNDFVSRLIVLLYDQLISTHTFSARYSLAATRYLAFILTGLPLIFAVACSVKQASI
ncbi:PIN domain-containing protein [Xenorhabdus cabanillasii]|uniref:hypothetical protein n=1 Tax=Xenorhabdus cabanillasii TaxID=351673 RepID=UPI002B401EB6|nr:hypothetical protein [Xenorhabdus sp. Flor]